MLGGLLAPLSLFILELNEASTLTSRFEIASDLGIGAFAIEVSLLPVLGEDFPLFCPAILFL